MATREETKRMIEVMQAYVDGAEIYTGGGAYISQPNWDWRNSVYTTKPTTRKVKLLAWFCGGIEHGSLFWTKENAIQLNHWKRVPSEDKEIEIEE